MLTVLYNGHRLGTSYFRKILICQRLGPRFNTIPSLTGNDICLNNTEFVNPFLHKCIC